MYALDPRDLVLANSDRETADDATDLALESKQSAWLLISVLIVAMCGIAYELIIAAVSSYLLGNSVAQFSITIGLFMFAMGVGSYLTKFMHESLVERFIEVEMAVAFIGGISAALLFLVFPYFSLYRPTMYVLILVIGALVGVEIPLLTRIISRKSSLSDSLAHVLSMDYIGALIGSVSFPLLLLPSLGLFRSSFVIGLLNISVAAIALRMFRRSHPRVSRYWIWTLLVMGLLLIGLLMSAWITRFAEGQLFADEIIFTEQTQYQRIVLTRHPRNAEVRLYLDGHLQFAGSDEHRYHESLVHPVMSVGDVPRRVLVLGGGDGLAIREILKYPTIESIELVDIDPAMTKLSRTLGAIRRLNGDSLDDPRVRVIHADAFNYVREAYVEAGHAIYDHIVIDLPDPHNEALSKLYSKEFYGFVRRVLTERGAFVTQSASPFITREAYWSIAATIRSAGFEVASFHVPLNSFGEWGFQLATHADSGVDPREVRIANVACRFMSTELFASSLVFGRDCESVEVPINSVFEPKLYLLYEMGLAR